MHRPSSRRSVDNAVCVFTLRVSALACLALGACAPEEITPVVWAFQFECEADAQRTDAIELQVAKGVCPITEQVVFETWTSTWDLELSRPQGLPAGEYAFHGTARDAHGDPIASHCESVKLPTQGVISLELRGTSACDTSVDPRLDAGSHDSGAPQGPPREPDAGLRADAGADTAADAGIDAASACADPSDRDGDGAADCIDGCPDDGEKTEQGQCGCGNVDLDQDRDGTADCNDECPVDPNKAEPGTCGCNPKNTLGPGERLLVGEYLCGPRDDSVRLTMEADGDLHLHVDGVQTWASTAKTDSMGQSGIQAKMQQDGNLVIRTASDVAVWSSATAHSEASVTSLAVNADGTVTIARGGTVVWSAGVAR